jgi:hypothetical protein
MMEITARRKLLFFFIDFSVQFKLYASALNRVPSYEEIQTIGYVYSITTRGSAFSTSSTSLQAVLCRKCIDGPFRLNEITIALCIHVSPHKCRDVNSSWTGGDTGATLLAIKRLP